MNDEGIDRLLRQVAAPGGSEATPCLDPETVAAFVGGGLSPAERAEAEAHIGGCERCLQLTAAVVRTEPPASEAPRRSWLRIGWLAPVTTMAAAGVAAWLMIRDPRPVEAPVRQDTTTAARADERAAPVLPSESAKAAVPEFRPAEPQRAESASRRAPSSVDALTRNRAVAERKAEADAAAQGPPPPAASPAAPPATAAAELARDGLVAAGQAPRMTLVASPDPLVQWRFADAVLESTADGGRTWMAHSPGAAGLLAGAAPARDVLWLTGRAGLVLLTTDGRTWQRVDLPDRAADAVQITAIDGRSARVTTAAGTTYRTTDAGRTWTLQEIPAASF